MTQMSINSGMDKFWYNPTLECMNFSYTQQNKFYKYNVQ